MSTQAVPMTRGRTAPHGVRFAGAGASTGYAARIALAFLLLALAAGARGDDPLTTAELVKFLRATAGSGSCSTCRARARSARPAPPRR